MAWQSDTLVSCENIISLLVETCIPYDFLLFIANTYTSLWTINILMRFILRKEVV